MFSQAKKPPAAAPNGESPSAAPASAPTVKKLPPAAAASSKPAKGGAAPPPGALDEFKYKHSPDNAEALAAETIPEAYATGLADANWKTRLATLEEMTGWVDTSAGELDSEVVVRFLAKKGWSEKNFQASIEFNCFTLIIADEFICRFRQNFTAFLTPSQSDVQPLVDHPLRYACRT